MHWTQRLLSKLLPEPAKPRKLNELELAKQEMLKAKRKYEALRAQWIDAHEIPG